MVKTKRVYDPPAKGDGRRILVDRLWPRGMKKEEAKIDEWMKDIAPGDELRKWYAHDPVKWQEFRKRYLTELKEKSGLVERLREESKKGTVTLLFAAKDAEHSNAAVLKQVLEQ